MTARTHGGVVSAFTLPLALLSALAAPAVAQPTHGPEMRVAGEVPYVTGGVGESEREAIEALARREGLNLKLVVASPEGTFLADIPVRILGPDGAVLLEVTTEGPWLLVRLPAGAYRVEARFRRGDRTATVTVPAEGRREVVLTAP